jgi:hypothetical protein
MDLRQALKENTPIDWNALVASWREFLRAKYDRPVR